MTQLITYIFSSISIFHFICEFISYFYSLNELESLQQATVDQIALNENVSRSAFELDNALVGTDAHDRIVLENQQRIDDLERRFFLSH